MLPASDLRRHSLFAMLDSQSIERLRARLIFRTVAPDGLILHRGVCANLLAGVVSGQVTLESEIGAQLSRGPGELFGEEMFLHGAPSRYAVRAGATPVQLWLLPRSVWLEAQAAPAARTAKPRSEKSSGPASLSAGPRAASRTSRWRAWAAVLVGLLLAVSVLGQPLVISGGSALALRAFESGRFDRANQFMDLALFLQPDSAMLHDSYGYLLYLQGNAAAAAGHLHRAADLDPGLAAARHNLGVLLLAQGDASGAAAHFEAVIDLDPGNALAYRNLGDAYLEAGRRADAARAYARAWSLDASLLEARARWAALILDDNRLEDACRAWQEVLDRQPGHPDAQLGLGAIRLLEGRPAEALSYLEAARLADPMDALTRLYLGLTLQALERPDQAAAEFERVLAFSHEPALADLARLRLAEINRQLAPLGEAVEGGGETADPK